MSKNYTLKAAKRDGTGKGVARALRRENKTPAVIYGDKKEPVRITLEQNEINVEYNKGRMSTTVCDLDVDGEKHTVLARDVQLHPVTDNVMHVDFLRVTPKTKISVEVPVQFINEKDSPGLRDKGILNVVRYTVEVNCMALSIPDVIEVDLAGKEQGDTVRISDASLPEGVEPVIDDRDFSIALVLEPKRIEEEPTEAPEGEEGEDGEGAEGEGAEGGEGEDGKDAKAEGDDKGGEGESKEG